MKLNKKYNVALRSNNCPSINTKEKEKENGIYERNGPLGQLPTFSPKKEERRHNKNNKPKNLNKE